MATLVSPGVQVNVNDRSIYAEAGGTTTALVVIATRENKTAPDGVNTALGTIEANKLRLIGSQNELRQYYGNPIFVTNDGAPVHGDETNEYGLLAVDSYLGIARRAYVLRADIDLSQLSPSKNEPSFPAPDNTYWIDTTKVVGGILQYDGTNWNPVPNFFVFTAPPTPSTGNDGDWGFDYTNADGTIVYKQSGQWKPASLANIQNDYGASTQFFVGGTSPVGANAGDFWYKTTSSAGGTNLALKRYSAPDNLWVNVAIVRDAIPPVPNAGTVWEDTGDILNSGKRPLYVGTGTAFIPLAVVVSATEPVTPPETGHLWFDDTYTDFAMYVEGTDFGRGNQWVPVITTTVNNPSATEKVISASAPAFPQEGSIWVDISTPENFDRFPVIKRWTSGQWVDISGDVIIDDTDPGASAVADGTYWINTGDRNTRNMVKEYDPDYEPVTVVLDPISNQYVTVPVTGVHWKPASGRLFGRKSVRYVVVKALQETISSNVEIRDEAVDFNLIACPGYPELYDEMVALNTDRKETAFIVADTPKFMVPKAIATGREITPPEWATNARNASSTGEDGFTSGRSKYAAFWYPWCITTNLDGNQVFMPPSHIALRTIAYSDLVANVWNPPAGTQRGIVTNADSVGYLDNNGNYVPTSVDNSARDTLYLNDINPIAYRPGRGLLVYGQKTWAPGTTAMDRINVSRLVIQIKRDLQRMLEDLLWEINNAVTRRTARNMVERYLAGIATNGGVYDYAVRCDEENNTPDIIDQNILKVDVLIKPAKAIEFIYIDLDLVSTGASLEF